jgi:hypothetical protein
MSNTPHSAATSQNVIPQWPIRDSFINRVRSQRCCSFCHLTGHNVTTCNDERLVTFHRLLCWKRDYLLQEYRNHSIRPIGLALTEYESWLFYQDSTLIRAYAMKNCGALSRYTADDYCKSIIMKIFNLSGMDMLALVMNVFGNNTSTNPSPQPAEQILFSQQPQINNENRFAIRISCLKKEEIIHIDTEADQVQQKECSICYDFANEEDCVKLNCDHEFCAKCVINTLKHTSSDIPNCAFCRAEIKNIHCKKEEIKAELCRFIF